MFCVLSASAATKCQRFYNDSMNAEWNWGRCLAGILHARNFKRLWRRKKNLFKGFLWLYKTFNEGIKSKRNKSTSKQSAILPKTECSWVKMASHRAFVSTLNKSWVMTYFRLRLVLRAAGLNAFLYQFSLDIWAVVNRWNTNIVGKWIHFKARDRQGFEESWLNHATNGFLSIW